MDSLVSNVAAPGVVLRLDDNSRLPACAAGLGSKRVIEDGLAHGKQLVYDAASDALVYSSVSPSPLAAMVGESTFKIHGLRVAEAPSGPILTSGNRKIADGGVLLIGGRIDAGASAGILVAYVASPTAGTFDVLVNGEVDVSIDASDGAHRVRYIYIPNSAVVSVGVVCTAGSVEVVAVYDTIGQGSAMFGDDFITINEDTTLESPYAWLSNSGVNYVGHGVNLLDAYYAEELLRFKSLSASFPLCSHPPHIVVGDEVVINSPIKTDHLVIYARKKCIVNATIDVSSSCRGDGLFGGAGSLPSGEFAFVGPKPVSYMKLGDLKYIAAENGTQPSVGAIQSTGYNGLYEARSGQGSSGAKVASASGVEWQSRGGGSVIIVAPEIELYAPILAKGEDGKVFDSIEDRANGKAGGGGGGVVLLRCFRLTRNPGIIDVSGYGNGWVGVMGI